jgi:hypothetical protein
MHKKLFYLTDDTAGSQRATASFSQERYLVSCVVFSHSRQVFRKRGFIDRSFSNIYYPEWSAMLFHMVNSSVQGKWASEDAHGIDQVR